MRDLHRSSALWITAWSRKTVQPPVAVHRAPWLLPVSRPPVRNGGLAVQSGRILELGRFNEVARNHPGAEVVDYPDAVLMPGLINAHAHLELSHLAYLSRRPSPSTFTGWIEHMLAERTKVGSEDKVIQEAARVVLADQQRQGVVVVADISNTGLTRDLSSEFTGRLFCFKEYLGLRASELTASLHSLKAEVEHPDVHCTAHAPYSTHIQLLLSLKNRAVRLGQIFPVHVAESSAEHAMVSRGRGEMLEFLEQRGFWDDSFQPTGMDSNGSVSYLHRHGLLDSGTLCVHCIHVTGQEIDLLVETATKVCLCPGSNRYLGVGKAPVDKYLHKGILPALGTDSLTSNPELSIWHEMCLLAEEHPGIDPMDILRMATLGGAEALGLGNQLGSLEPGKEAAIIAVQLTEPVRSTFSLAEYLVYQNHQEPYLLRVSIAKTMQQRTALSRLLNVVPSG
ncbi:MAG: amidohydrolase [Candidatus Electrothrix sp. AR4]|nr:amidohydrolase [Candidatus Electrothrix sp. AR4]